MSDNELSNEDEDSITLAYNRTTKHEKNSDKNMFPWLRCTRLLQYGYVVRSIAIIAAYFVPSIGLTFYQRWFLKDFSFPIMVVLVHLLVKFALAAFIRFLITDRANVSFHVAKGIIWVAIFSSLDIGLSNWGIKLVHVSMYSMTKSTTVIFILIAAIVFKLEQKSWSQVVIVVLISSGLCLFTYKAQAFNAFGFTLLILSSACSGVRWTCAQLMLHKSKNPLEMIYLVQPWMFIALLPLALVKEGPLLVSHLKEMHMSSHTYVRCIEVLFGSLLAFILEFTEFLVVTHTSSLTLSVAGIVKEIIIIGLAVVINHDRISAINLLGLLLCLSGIASHASYKLKAREKSRANGVSNRELFRHGQQAPLMGSETNSSENEESDTQVIFNVLKSRD